MSGPRRLDWDEGSPERLYVLTGGRSGSTAREPLDLVTLIVSRSAPDPGLQPEHAAIVRMCEYPLSVAEISAYLALPASVVMVLLSDLLSQRRVEARPPIPAASLPDAVLLEAVMHGLRKL
ncbi:DUF742 domain-containing protein [Yinghuangia seranimata]|uniref:DUF742 domain-containing protein n=1 Tax=Yinghuangia seranimata TaxID=408067 RepID=UPI00248AF80E|nr:DUF742 domain-containing protein [Yinghuangia seranimata]MDI2130044.1 DUF742 domain-containing protein [Yinghuangia seranimata]